HQPPDARQRVRGRERREPGLHCVLGASEQLVLRPAQRARVGLALLAGERRRHQDALVIFIGRDVRHQMFTQVSVTVVSFATSVAAMSVSSSSVVAFWTPSGLISASMAALAKN